MLGLPWTNPLKIQIGSDEHIIDTTINRGLTMLLNNDYYLDMKANILSKQLSSVITNVESMWDKLESHLADENMHYNDTVKITYENHNQYTYNYSFGGGNSLNDINNSKLYKDTIKYLSIGWNAAKIQQVIDETPHDLNGFNLIFLFVVPEGYQNEVEDVFELDIKNDVIKFNNFINGSLIVFGQWLGQENSFGFAKFNEGEYKSAAEIDDPIVNDNLNVKKFVNSYQLSENNPEMIDDIIHFEEDRTIENKLNKIKIKGTSLNDEYSLVSFIQNTADVHVKNLSFESTLNKTTLNVDEIDINEYEMSSLPTTEQLLLMYPFETDNKPYISESFKSNIKKNKVKPLVSEIDRIYE